MHDDDGKTHFEIRCGNSGGRDYQYIKVLISIKVLGYNCIMEKEKSTFDISRSITLSTRSNESLLDRCGSKSWCDV